MKKIRNALFIITFALLLFTPIGISITASKGIAFPSWLEAGRTYSYLEGRELTTPPPISKTSLLSGEFQSDLEAYFSDHLPLRSTCIFVPAALQRKLIDTSNLLFNFECYPTYYGSNGFYIPAVQAVSGKPSSYSQKFMENLSAFANDFVAFTKRYPTKRFIILMPAGDNTPDISPFHTLTNNPLPARAVADYLQEYFEPCENIFFVTDAGSYTSLEEYYDYYYKTDHHWNARGVAKNFNLLAEKVNFEPVNYSEIVVVGSEPFVGSTGRSARCPESDIPIDIAHDYSSVSFVTNDETVENAADHIGYFQSNTELQRYNFDGLYFSAASKYFGPSSGTALLICDSFGAQIARLLAEQYETLYRFTDAHNQSRGGSLQTRMNETSPDDVIFVSNSLDLQLFPLKIPDYFE